MTNRPPSRLYILFGLQFLLALFFLLMGWSHTVSLAQGRPAALVDVLALAFPAIAVAICAVLSVIAWKRQATSLASLLVIAPFPAAVALYMLLGAI